LNPKPGDIREINLEADHGYAAFKEFEFRRKTGNSDVLEIVHKPTKMYIEIKENEKQVHLGHRFYNKIWTDEVNDELDEAIEKAVKELEKSSQSISNLAVTVFGAALRASTVFEWENIPLTHCEKENFTGTGFDDISLGSTIGGNKILRCDPPFSGAQVTNTCQDDGTWESERPVCTQSTEESKKVHVTTTLYYRGLSTNEENNEIEIGKINTDYYRRPYFYHLTKTDTQYLPGQNSNELILKLKDDDLEIPLKNGETQSLKDIEKKMYENMSDKELLKYISNYSLFRDHFSDYKYNGKNLRIDGNREKVIKEILDNDLNKNFPTKILSKWTNINSPNVDYHPQPYYEPASEENETLPVYAIVLIVVGGVLVFAGIGLAVYCLKCRKKSQSEEQFILEVEEDQSKIKVTAIGIKEEIEV
jgi:hypothetical protein